MTQGASPAMSRFRPAAPWSCRAFRRNDASIAAHRRADTRLTESRQVRRASRATSRHQHGQAAREVTGTPHSGARLRGLGVDTELGCRREPNRARLVLLEPADPPFSSVTHPFVSRVGEGARRWTWCAPPAVSRTHTPAELGGGGQSQGGHAALSTAEVVKQGYDTDLRLRAVIAARPPRVRDRNGIGPEERRGGAGHRQRHAGESRPARDLYLNTARRARSTTPPTATAWTEWLVGMWALYGAAGNPWVRDPYTDPAALAVIRENSPGTWPGHSGVRRRGAGDPLISQSRTRKSSTERVPAAAT